MRRNEWTPILSADGVTYCSPGCGFGCTRAEHDAAEAKAAEMAKQMGAGWSSIIWENGGWHAKVKKGCAEVYCDDFASSDRFSAWITLNDQQFIHDAATPEDALGFAVQAARTAIARMNAALADLLEGADA